ncbi:undecaprenyl-phosphate glucose phosphotransferase [Pararobbsia silviterrae]|uniref:Undecaprenyl-phosphate glucose phosphotransferase n=2 Tax=Pararobbsia silviterrae TaxID=1792498 RepID=A0A494XZS7_9BURK|nr:undecaprenyl-phosphate glucose phosphotransferase [Pararobbsia silviterrae]
MALVGVISAVLNTAAFFVLLPTNGQIAGTPYARALTGTLAVAAFVIFVRFHLVSSARNLWWMLSQGALRWFRLLIVLVVLLFFTHDGSGELRTLLIEWTALALPLQLIGLALLRAAAHAINNAPGNQRHAVFFGFCSEARRLNLRLQRSPLLGIRIDGYYNEMPVVPEPGETLPPYLGRYADAAARVQANDFQMVFIAMGEFNRENLTTEIMDRLYDSTAAIYLVPELRFFDGPTTSSASLAGVPLLALHDIRILGLSRMVKRLVDIAGASLMLLMLSPLMVLIAIAVRLDSAGPILFRQVRYGERGEPINVRKFRSMRFTPRKEDEEAEGEVRQARVGDGRITTVGRFLRRSSLDELPQLFNVVGGSMSLIGPRPHAAEHNELYRRLIPGYMLRHSVKPGITGWAQINGLRGITDTPDKMERRVEYDRYYITNWSLWLDLEILVKTIPSIILGRNAV